MTSGTQLAIVAVAREGALRGALPPEVRVLTNGEGLAALCADPGRVAGGFARLRLVQAIEARIGTVLPVAAGCAARTGIRAWLRSDAAGLDAGLARVSGCSEIVLTLSVLADPPGPPAAQEAVPMPSGGRAWLRTRAAVARAGAEMRDRLLRQSLALVAGTGAAWRAARADPFGHPVGGVDVVLLVPSGSAARLVQRLTEVGTGRPGAPMAVTGPWPCYTFAAVDLLVPAADPGAAA